jgi:hypothetical protein
MKSANDKLGGAGLTVQGGVDKTEPMKKSVVQHVHGTNPTDKKMGSHTLLNHSPIKAKGK